MNRIERNGRTYPAWFDSDSHLAELVRGAEQKRSPLRDAIEIGAAWVGVILVCGVIWYGVLKALGAL